MGCGDACPVIPVKKQLRADWDLPDPKDRPLDEVRATRDDIDHRVRDLVAEFDRGMLPWPGGVFSYGWPTTAG
jgi:arsenate reductase